jgi:hypothetical protein
MKAPRVRAAWTELTPMRVLVVEFATEGADPLLLEDGAIERQPGSQLSRRLSQGLPKVSSR